MWTSVQVWASANVCKTKQNEWDRAEHLERIDDDHGDDDYSATYDENLIIRVHMKNIVCSCCVFAVFFSLSGRSF